jgi:hypothetical protein
MKFSITVGAKKCQGAKMQYILGDEGICGTSTYRPHIQKVKSSSEHCRPPLQHSVAMPASRDYASLHHVSPIIALPKLCI